MYTATKANVRTTTAAHEDGAPAALSVAFFGGSIMGLTVASMGLLGLGSLYYFFGGDPETAHHIHGFGMGASVVALFSRVGGGIYTKSADVGADLVGKVEAGIPEDDPRNPGVIADNVGDNVGDVAGMGSDIFESYCGAMIATIAIASTLGLAYVTDLAPALPEADGRAALMSLPLLLASVGLSHKSRARPSELSHGERQRVAVCRAMLNRPELLLADEPTGNLDQANKRKVVDLLIRQARESGSTLVMVTHDRGLLDAFERVIDFEALTGQSQ